MKTKRLLSFILVVCMVLSVFAVGIVSTYAADVENTPAEGVEYAPEDTEREYTYWWATYPAWFADFGMLDNNWSEYRSLIEDYYIDKIDLDDYSFFPFYIIASQSGTEGTIDALLCVTSYSTEKMKLDKIGMDSVQEFYYHYRSALLSVFTVFTDNSGNKRIINAEFIDPEKIIKPDNIPEGGNTPWIITDKQTESVNDLYNYTLKNYDGMKLSFISEIGELMKGIYNTGKALLLCYGTDASGTTDLYVVEIQVDDKNTSYDTSDDTAEITDVSFLNLSEYVSSQAEINELINKTNNNTGNEDETQNNTESNANSQNESISAESSGTTNDSSSSSGSSTTTGSSASATSPKTGQEETIVFVMLGVMILASAVIFFVRKRERT